MSNSSKSITRPSPGSGSAGHSNDTDPKQLKCGGATKFWLELMAYPQDSARSLWLYVDEDWKCLDDPSEAVQASVQNAFGPNTDLFEVLVWYPEDNESSIHGLVVHSK